MDTRPDPGSATTPGEFLQALRHLRAWAGQPSLRTLTALAGTDPESGTPPADVLPVSTLSDNLAGKRLPNLPRLPFVIAFVTACLRAGDVNDGEQVAAEVDRWTRSWHALSPDAPQPLPEPETATGAEPEPPSKAGPAHARPRTRRRPPVRALLAGAAAGAALVWLVTLVTGGESPAPPPAVPSEVAAVPSVPSGPPETRPEPTPTDATPSATPTSRPVTAPRSPDSEPAPSSPSGSASASSSSEPSPSPSGNPYHPTRHPSYDEIMKAARGENSP